MDVERLRVLVTLKAGDKVWNAGCIVKAPIPPVLMSELRYGSGTVEVLERKAPAPSLPQPSPPESVAEESKVEVESSTVPDIEPPIEPATEHMEPSIEPATEHMEPAMPVMPVMPEPVPAPAPPVPSPDLVKDKTKVKVKGTGGKKKKAGVKPKTI